MNGHPHIDTLVIHGGGSSIHMGGTIEVPIHSGSVTVTPYVSPYIVDGHSGIGGVGANITIGW